MSALAGDAAARKPAFEGLTIRGVAKSFGPVRVLESIDLDIRPGECIAVLGENGAGKSTLSSIIAGVVQPSAGEMTWNGEPYAPRSPAEALSRGIGLIHQEMRLLPELSIAENVFVGRLLTKGGRIDRAEMNRRAETQMKRLGLNVPATAKVGTLKVAAQQQVEIAKALTLQASLLIFDEPTAALGGKETDRLFEQIRRLKAEGVASVYISHRLEEIARIADRIAVLRDGNLIAVHDKATVPVRQLAEEMVGRSVERLFPDLPSPQPRDVLNVSDLTSAAGAFRDISFSVRAGEIFGIAGIVGAGRTELVRAIAGVDALSSGEVRLEGRPLKLRQPQDAMRAGIVLVPEDRKAQGLLLKQTIENNIAVGNFDLIAGGSWIGPKAKRTFAEKAIASMGVKGRPEQLAGRQSAEGGDRQTAGARAQALHHGRADARRRRRRQGTDLRGHRGSGAVRHGRDRRLLGSRRGDRPVASRHGALARTKPRHPRSRGGDARRHHGTRDDLSAAAACRKGNPMKLFDLSGSVALVTGAGSGIGQRIAVGLGEAGADVALLDRRSDDGLAKTAASIAALGRRSISLAADVTSAGALADAVARTERELGPLRFAVNAAGIANADPAEAMEESQFQTMMDVNLKGVFLSAQAEARAMLAHGRGSIVNIASMSGVIVNRGLSQCHYNASKAGVIHMSKSMAMEWVGRGIRVNTISPGYTATPMNTRPEMVHQTKLFEEQTPMGRMASVDEMVGPAVFLLSGAASFVTGVDLLVDGGFCCW
ncbi:Vitamin B12 import ATP-binding protein BtuD [Methylorubrum podarium]|nr:Vitamin B12 import ATP-binding protein BtuD [Methylorubrum podarium]